MAESNNVLFAAIAGFAGAVAVNAVHELIRKVHPDAPRMDVVGMRALAKMARAAGAEPPDNLRTATFAGDIAANTVYYSLVAAAGANRAVTAGALMGGIAGVGGVLLPPPMNLGDREVNRTPTTQALVVAYYLTGGLVAGAVYKALAGRNRNR